MKKFKFFKGVEKDEPSVYNGVTDSYLIELSRNITTYSDWVFSTMLSIDEITGLDSLIIEFTDIDNSDYLCRILSNGSFELFQEIYDVHINSEVYQIVEFNDTSNANIFINYLRNMPKTIISSL